MATRPVPSVKIDLIDPDTMELWRTVMTVARELEREGIRWSLVGGLMVALFAMEAGQLARPTSDIDILGDARQRPSGTEAVSARLEALDAKLPEVTGVDKDKGFRFELEGHVVDVLAPDGLASPAKTTGKLRTIQIPGGTQALERTEAVEIVIDRDRAHIFRPSLLGAILLKARSLRVHDKPEDQRADLITLLGLMTDPRAAAAGIKKSEVKWLRLIESQLNLDDPDLEATVDAAELQIARASYRRLTL
jgi:hypothetical protein